METIKDIIASFMRDLEGKARHCGDDPETLLRTILTKKELRHIKVNYFRNGALHLNVDSSAWFYSLSLQKEELLSKLKKYSAAIKDIKLRLGKIK
jgi:hypothetical protein